MLNVPALSTRFSAPEAFSGAENRFSFYCPTLTPGSPSSY
jgi:hypothetical protein